MNNANTIAFDVDHRGGTQPGGDEIFVKIREKLAEVQAASPFYRAHLDGIDPERVCSEEDFSRVPPVTGLDLRSEGMKLLCVSPSLISRIVTLETSGTTGLPKRICFTDEDLEQTVQFFMAGMGTFTSVGDRVLILLPGERPSSIGDLLGRALIRLGAVPVQGGLVTNLPQTLETLTSGYFDSVVGIPTHVLALARWHAASGAPPISSLRHILLSTDNISASLAGELERLWNCRVIRYFGMTELGYGGGIECPQHSYHLFEDDFYAEIIDPETGLRVPDGTWGELVVTTLRRKGMPLIRYRTGDITRFIPGSCPCGSAHRRLDQMIARKGATYSTRGGIPLRLSLLDEVLFGMPSVVDFYAEFVQDSNAEYLKILVEVMGASFDTLDCLERVAAATKLESEIGFLACGGNYVPRYGKRKIVLGTRS